MAKDIYEIVWHARGGQGAKTAATLVAEVALTEGRHSQGFPEYGPERMGAPIRGFTRISERPIRIHSAVYYPDAVVVLDDTLLSTVNVAENLAPDGVVILNSAKPPGEARKLVPLQSQGMYAVDASRISREEIGRDIPNTPMLGAFVKVTGRVGLETVLEDVKKKFGGKLDAKMLEGNLRAVRRGFEEVHRI